MKCECKTPYGISSGKKIKNKWIWDNVKWIKCNCGMWHSNRFIPNEFWNQNWKFLPVKDRKKSGIILIRDSNEVWITQSYNRCYGFPKGEKELGETLEQCAKREFYEETGVNINELDLSKFRMISIYIENVEYVYYIIHVPDTFQVTTYPKDDVEITSFGWIELSKINNLFLSKAVKKLLCSENLLV